MHFIVTALISQKYLAENIYDNYYSLEQEEYTALIFPCL